MAGKWLSALAVLLVFASQVPARAESCPAQAFADAVDRSGAALRDFNADAQPKLKERILALRVKKGWPENGLEEKAYDYLQDDRMAAFDTRSNALLGQIDTLGRQGEQGSEDCAALAELKSAGDGLLAVMKEKSAYLLARIDNETGVEAAAAPAPTSPASPAAVAKAPPDTAAQPWSTKTTPSAPGIAAPAPTPQATPPQPPPSQATGPALPDATVSDAYTAPLAAEPLPAQAFTTDEGGYSIDEIRDATSGFFGSVSTNLASVIEHTFSIAGRPTGYVLGQEGGGAFLAGLRYGDGTLYMRTGGTQKVYWHGPTIGADLGVAGSRTLFLIYKLKNPADIYRSFTGLDGSAYLVGGVGVTLMKGGKVIMAPIRSGLGLRLGANIGYVRFTDRPTWNPF